MKELNKREQCICIWLTDMSKDKVLEGIVVMRWREMFVLLATTVYENSNGEGGVRGRGV